MGQKLLQLTNSSDTNPSKNLLGIQTLIAKLRNFPEPIPTPSDSKIRDLLHTLPDLGQL